MTKTQNIEVCNQIIAQLSQDKPFVLKLTKPQYTIFLNVWHNTECVNCSFESYEDNGLICIEINEQNFDALYHKLSSYIAKHDLPEDVKQSLKEVS